MKAKKTVCKVRDITKLLLTKFVNFELIKTLFLKLGEHFVNLHAEREMKRKRKGGGTVAIV